MKITAGSKGDAIREEAQRDMDKAENQFYWDAYNYTLGRDRMEEEYDARTSKTTQDIRSKIVDKLTNAKAIEIFNKDVKVVIQEGSGNTTFSRNRDSEYISRRSSNPEKITVFISNDSNWDLPFRWSWKARFMYNWSSSDYQFSNDVSTYNFGSSDIKPEHIQYFIACGDIFKALSEIDWETILTTDPYAGMEDILVHAPDYNWEAHASSERAIKQADIEDAIKEWKRGDKWLYVGKAGKQYNYDYKTGRSFYSDSPQRDTINSDLLNGVGYYRYIGETDKYYRVEFMDAYTGRDKLKRGEPAEPNSWSRRDKVRKDEFEANIFYPITWWGKVDNAQAYR